MTQRVYACLLTLGAGILLGLTIAMMASGAMTILVAWVSGLLVLESAIDVATGVASVRWWISGARRHATAALRLGAGAAILHAVRVLIFVLGRTGPWFDFDVRPEHVAAHADTWTWGGVYFAAVMSVLGVLGVLIIWRIRRRNRTARL